MLTISNLTKTYRGGKKAVDSLNIEVESGQIYGFIGHNGAGKTTTLRCVSGILDFDSGSISIDGIDLMKDPVEAKRRMAYIPDNPDIYEYLTGFQYLNFVADMYDMPLKERHDAMLAPADALEIRSALSSLISSYSHGMKQKLVLVSALMHEPRLLILDEPFVGLDPKASLTLREYMHSLCAKGSAIFFSTHVLDVAQKLCTHVGIIKNGKLVVSGETADVTADSSLEDVFMELYDEK